MRKFSVYKITNKINNKLYIGKTQGNAANRWRRHIRIATKGKNKYPRLFFAIHAAIRKYGATQFFFEVIEDVDSEEKSFEREKFWISFFKQNHKLYNLTDGGDGPSGRKPSLEARHKMSEAQRGEKSWKAKLTEEDVKNIKHHLMEEKITQKEIAKLFGVNHETINLIYKEKYWGWVKVPGFVHKDKYASAPTNAKLTENDVRDIKQLLLVTGLTQKEIAAKFNVAVQTICLINTGKRWAHV